MEISNGILQMTSRYLITLEIKTQLIQPINLLVFAMMECYGFLERLSLLLRRTTYLKLKILAISEDILADHWIIVQIKLMLENI